jgi:hypothetical protein
MSKDDSTTASPVRRAILELKDEHAQIMGVVDQVANVSDAEALGPLLEKLHGLLKSHFAHEEYPDGLYATMGACTAEYRSDLRKLVDEHFGLLSTVRGMSERARLGHTEGLVEEAGDLAQRLRDHETHEHALAAKLADA